MDEKKTVFLDDKETAPEEIQKLRETLPKDKRIVEAEPDHFKTLTRLKE